MANAVVMYVAEQTPYIGFLASSDLQLTSFQVIQTYITKAARELWW